MTLIKTISYLMAFYLKIDKEQTQQELFSEALNEASIDIAKKMGYKIDE